MIDHIAQLFVEEIWNIILSGIKFREERNILLIFNTLMVVLGAAALADFAQPRSPSAWLAACLSFMWAIILALTESLGRLCYTPAAITVASILCGAAGVAYFLRKGLLSNQKNTVTRWARRIRVVTWSALKTPVALLWCVLALWALVTVVYIPPTVHDSLSYHLLPAVEWTRMGVVQVVQHLDYRADYYPHGFHALYAWCFLLSGKISAVGLANVVFTSMLWPLAVYCFLRSLKIRRRYALLGILLVSVNPQVLEQMNNELVDVPFAATLLLSLGCVIAGPHLYGRHALMVGVAGGLCLGTKTAGVVIAPFCLFSSFVAEFLRCRAKATPSPCKSSLRYVVLSTTVLLAIGSWDYASNLFTHGNPFYPIPVHIGPMQLPHPDLSHMDPFLNSMNSSPLRNIRVGLSRLLPLALSLPPFQEIIHGPTAGYGPLAPYMTLGCCFLFILLSIINGVRKTMGHVFDTSGCVAIGLIFCSIVLFYAAVNPEAAKPWWNLTRARYIMQFLVVPGFMFVKMLQLVPLQPRKAITMTTVAVVLASAGYLEVNAGARSYKDLQTVLKDKWRLEDFYRNPRWRELPDPERYYSLISANEPVIVIAKTTRTFPLYLPSFTRTVYLTSPWGPFRTVPDISGMPREIVLACKHFVIEESARSGRPVYAWDSIPAGAFELGIPFIESLARLKGISTVVSLVGPVDLVEGRPGWKLLWSEPKPHPLSVYRYSTPRD